MFLKGLEFYQKAEPRSRRDAVPELDAAGADLRGVAAVPGRDARRRRTAQGGRRAAAERAATQGAEASAKAAGSANPTSRASPARSGSGQPQLAIPLELAVQSPTPDARAQAARGRLRARRPARRCRRGVHAYLDANPTDQAALLGALFGTYIRHLNAPQPATLAADRTNMAKWAKAYAATKGPIQPLVSAWAKHVQGLK